MKSPKVFCVGFQKTGTTSLEIALARLGYRVAKSYGLELSLEALRREHLERGMALLESHDAVEDVPWNIMFRDLDAAFPDAKFILTLRDRESWLRSICGHFGATPHPMQQFVYGEDAPCPIGHEARYQQVFDAHNAAVRAHFAGRPGKLLELNIMGGEGWPELCAFLGATAPDEPFPKLNTSGRRRSLKRRILRRLRGWGLPV